MDGYTTTVKIRSLDMALGLHTPVVAMTAAAAEEDRQRCPVAGMDDSSPSRCKLRNSAASWPLERGGVRGVATGRGASISFIR